MTLQIGRTRLTAHPLALMFPLTALLLGAGDDMAALLVALAVHEGAHLLAAKALGVGISQLRLTPFGGAMTLDNPYALPAARLVGVACAGPLANALAMLTTAALAHWRLLQPQFAILSIQTNLTLMAFNLLPALPLDGGRMAYALLSRRVRPARALELGILLGRVVAAGLTAACAALALRWGRINLSFLFAAVFILSSATDERNALGDARVETLLGALKPLGRPVPVRLWALPADCDLRAALRVARSGYLTLYAIYDDNRLSSFTDDRRLLEAALKRGMSAQVGELIGATRLTGRPPRPGSAS